MNTAIAIGTQSFEKIRGANSFYVDKTQFIKEWWENKDDVTLITRPRRFGFYHGFVLGLLQMQNLIMLLLQIGRVVWAGMM